MADFMKFRTSMGGFNRSDVSNYIESLCAEHARTTKKLQEENTALAERVQKLEAEAAANAEERDAAKAQLGELQTALNSTEAALEEALVMVEEQEALRAAEAEQAAEAAPDYAALELEAYRRAEATERLAQDRAARLRMQLNNLLDQISARYEQTGQEIEALSEDIRTNMKRLQEALSDLNLIFEETTDHFDTMDADAVDMEHE